MKTLIDLAEWADEMPRRIKTAASNAAVFASKALVTNLSIYTPVDTTKAMSNWIVSLGVPAYNVINPHVPGHFGYTATGSRAATLAAATATLSRKQPGQPVYVGNNADYIKDLNNGSSKQEPAGFVERAVMSARRQVSSYKLNLKGIP